MKSLAWRNDRFFFSRLLIAIIIANFASLVLLNLLELSSYSLVYFYAIALLAFYQMTGKLVFRRSGYVIDNISVWMCAVSLVLLTIPRLSYLLEWIPGNEVRVISDDGMRLAELISMTLSQRYPLQHPANGEYLLSFYYAALYPMAFFKFVLPPLTLKNTIFLGNFLYHILILGSMLEIAHLLLNSKVSVRVFVFLFTLFSGLEGLLRPLSGMNEWWQRELFQGNAQISAFFTGMFWVIHHFVAFYAILLAYVLLFYTRASYTRVLNRTIKILLVLLLLASAFYTSPFSFMALPLFALVHMRVIWRRLVRTRVFPYVAVTALVPLFIFLNKLPGQGFTIATARLDFTGNFWIDKLLSAPIYLVIVPVVEYAAIPFLLLLVWRQMARVEKAYFLAAVCYFCLTYVVAYSGSNNFSMRGMFLPTVVIFFLFAKYAPSIVESVRSYRVGGQVARVATAAVVILTIIGTVKMFGALLRDSIRGNLISYQIAGVSNLLGTQTLPADLQVRYAEVIWNSEVTSIQPGAAERGTVYKYNAEKLIDRLQLEEMSGWEKEILRLPRRSLFY